MVDSCATCFFFSPQTYTDPAGNVIVQNACRRFAPGVSNNPGQAKWPFVQGTDWCGEFSNTDPHVYSATLLDIAPWTVYTPTIASSVGTITSANGQGYYKIIGKTCFFRVSVNIVTNGTGSGLINVGLPATGVAAGFAIIPGDGNAGTYVTKMHKGYISGSATFMGVLVYDGTYPGNSGAQFTLSGLYEIAS